MLFDNPVLQQLKQQFESQKKSDPNYQKKVKEKPHGPRPQSRPSPQQTASRSSLSVEGTVKATSRGFGFLETPDASFFINPRDMKRVMHGDQITAILISDAHSDRDRATPAKLIESSLNRFVGQVAFSAGKLCVIPNDALIRTPIHATASAEHQLPQFSNGDFVVCNLTKHALTDDVFACEITEYICAEKDPQAPWLVSLRTQDLPLKEPDGADFVFGEETAAYKDLTHLPFVTIDSEHTQDMDDALFVTKDASEYVLHVAIADPTGYIPQDSRLDDIAKTRVFSIYLPGRDIPMLPRELAENLCSLRPGEKRYALTAAVHISLLGEILFDKTEFKLAVIKSAGKLSYQDVSDFLEGQQTEFSPRPEIAALLHLLAEFAAVRRDARSRLMGLPGNHRDYEFILNAQGGLDHIEPEISRTADSIVEESMIAANIVCGQYLRDHAGCGVFNVHRGFDNSKKKELLAFLAHAGCPLDNLQSDTLEGYRTVRRFAAASADSVYIDTKLMHMHAMSQMSTTAEPHYALGADAYATWTSPIRKYGDMVNHRLLKACIRHQDVSSVKIPDDESLKTMNLSRKRNRSAERSVRSWLYTDYLAGAITAGTVFDSEILDINRASLKVILTDNGALVTIPGSSICTNRDRMEIDPELGELRIDGRVVMRLGDSLKVRLTECDRLARSLLGAPADGVNLPH